MRINSYIYTPKNFNTFSGAFAEQRKEEIDRRSKIVEAELQSAIDKRQKLTILDISTSTGLTEAEIRTIFNNYANIGALWSQVCTRPVKRSTKEELVQRKKRVEAVLLDAKNNRRIITLDEISQKTGITKTAVSKYVQNDKDLNALWFKVKSQDHVVFTKEKMQEQSDLIAEQIRLATEQKRTLTRAEISEATGIDKEIVKGRFETDSALKKLWQENQAIADKNYNLEVGRIKKVLQEAKRSGLKITYGYISQTTSIAIDIVKARIAQNSSLNKLFDKVRAFEYDTRTEEEIVEQNSNIAAVLNEAIVNEQKMTFDEFAAKIEGMKLSTVYSRIRQNPDLRTLWDKVKTVERPSVPQYDVEAKSTEIEQILTELKNKNEKTTLSRLATMVDLTPTVAKTCIQKSQKLSALWDATLSKPAHQYTEDEIEVHSVLIERILRQRIQDKTKASVYQMVQYLDLSQGYLEKLIKNSPDLNSLFEMAQHPEIQSLTP